MSISGISSTYTSSMIQEWQSSMQQRRQDFSQLGNALQSGDLTGAQQAYSDLQNLLQNSSSPFNSNTSSGSNPITDDFKALGQALSSGDLSQAQTDFTKLQDDMKAARQQAVQQGSFTQGAGHAHHGHHHHHVADSDASTTSSTTSSTADTNSSSTNSVNLLG